MSFIAELFAKPAIKYGAILLGVLAIAGGVVYFQTTWFNKGMASGEAKVTTAVEATTIKATEKARINKDKADAEVQATPFDDRVDGLR